MHNTEATSATSAPADTSRVHIFGTRGCAHQWAGDHDQAHCYAAFLAAEAKAKR